MLRGLPTCRKPRWKSNKCPCSTAALFVEPERESMEPWRFHLVLMRLEPQVRKVIVGHDDVIRQVLIAFFAGGHVLLEGVPGLGKTLLVKSLSHVLGVSFKRIQFTPDLMPSDIVGTEVLAEASGRREFQFKKGP